LIDTSIIEQWISAASAVCGSGGASQTAGRTWLTWGVGKVRTRGTRGANGKGAACGTAGGANLTGWLSIHCFRIIATYHL